MHAVNHRTRTEEEQSFEEGVRDHVKDRGDERAHATGQKHVAELRNGRIGQHFLDVVLRESDGRGKDSRCSTDDGDDEHRRRRMRVNGRTANDHVDAGSDHRCRMNQSGNRRRTSHRVRQPHVKRNLRALARRANEKKYRNRGSAAGKQRLPGKRVDAHAGE